MNYRQNGSSDCSLLAVLQIVIVTATRRNHSPKELEFPFFRKGKFDSSSYFCDSQRILFIIISIVLFNKEKWNAFIIWIHNVAHTATCMTHAWSVWTRVCISRCTRWQSASVLVPQTDFGCQNFLLKSDKIRWSRPKSVEISSFLFGVRMKAVDEIGGLPFGSTSLFVFCFGTGSCNCQWKVSQSERTKNAA